MDDKRFFLVRLIEEHPDNKILVFVRTKVRAERVHQALLRANVESLTLHGDVVRLTVLQKFRDGIVKGAYQTSVQRHWHRQCGICRQLQPAICRKTTYTASGERQSGTQKGRAVSFCSPEERPILETIEAFLTKPIAVLDITNNSYKDTIELNNDHGQVERNHERNWNCRWWERKKKKSKK